MLEEPYYSRFLDIISNGVNVNEKILNHETLLHYASRNGYLDMVKKLLDYGANVDQITSFNGYTPLWMASQNNHLDVVMALLSAGANVNKVISDSRSSLYIASKNGYFDIKHSTTMGKTSLQIAIDSNR